MEEIEQLLQAYRGDDGPVERVLGIIGVGRQGPGQVDEAIMIVKLKPWSERDKMQQALAGELMGRLQGVSAVRATLLTLFVVPGLYLLLGRFTGRTGAVGERLNELEQRQRQEGSGVPDHGMPGHKPKATLEKGPHTEGTT